MFKVFNAEGAKRGTLVFAEDAARLVSDYGNGATIRVGRHTVWTEGGETQGAAESFDFVAELVSKRAALYQTPESTEG